ncbi:hypothetical protein BX600DRAFT_448643 [Xylariales sp. PMI_506]|nr:hypothetical protein BX600DRAFT_448643 [Xylariales sp. PMI_506]
MIRTTLLPLMSPICHRRLGRLWLHALATTTVEAGHSWMPGQSESGVRSQDCMPIEWIILRSIANFGPVLPIVPSSHHPSTRT